MICSEHIWKHVTQMAEWQIWMCLNLPVIEETPIRTRVIEYEQDDDIKAVCLTDVLNDGLSMVYSLTLIYRPFIGTH